MMRADSLERQTIFSTHMKGYQMNIVITKAPEVLAHLVGQKAELTESEGARGTGTRFAKLKTGGAVGIFVGADSGIEYRPE